MPPIVFVASAAASSYSSPTITFPIPTGANKGDVVVAIVVAIGASPPAITSTDFAVLSIGITGGSFGILRRVLTGAEGTTLTASISNTPTRVAGVALLYRGVTTATTATGSANFAAAVTSFPSSSIATSYGDVVLMATITNTAQAITPPAGMTERYDAALLLGAGQLEVAESLTEISGLTGVRTSTVSVADTGNVVIASLIANGVAGADKAITGYLVPGAIGLPTKGI